MIRVRRGCLLIPLFSLLIGTISAESRTDDLKLRLESEKQTYALYEPVTIKYEIVNVSDRAISVEGSLAISTGFIRFEVASEHGEFQKYSTGGSVDIVGNTVLQAGEKGSAQVVMITNSRGIAAQSAVGRFHPDVGISPLPFPSEGKYRVRARFPIGNRQFLHSNTLHIVVRSLTDVERSTIDFFEDKADLIAAMGGERIAKDTRQEDRPAKFARWDEFVETHPDTPYTPYIRLNLAGIYESGYGLPNPQPDRAIELVTAVMEDGPSFLADDAMLYVARLQFESGFKDQAQATIERFFREYPESEKAGTARRMTDRFASE